MITTAATGTTEYYSTGEYKGHTVFLHVPEPEGMDCPHWLVVVTHGLEELWTGFIMCRYCCGVGRDPTDDEQ